MTGRTPDGTVFDVTGMEGAATVVLMHGVGLNRQVWQWMVPALSARFRVVTYDLLGHGGSVAPEGVPGLCDLSDQLAGLLDHLGCVRAGIVGFSLGGMVARRFAQDHPDRTAALAILHSPHRRSADAQAAILARIAQTARSGPAETVDAALVRWFTDRCRAAQPGLMALVRSWVMANDPAVYPKLYRLLAEGIDEILAPQPPIACPALVLTSDEDFGNGPEMSAAIAAEIPGAQLVILRGLRHMALAEAPDAVNRPVAEFLGRVLV
jgi:(E)-2-((N-methylformamido)methylene)succinate hydrolase